MQRGLETPSKRRIFRSKGNFLECAYNVTRANATVSLDPPDANKAGAHGLCPLVLPWAADTGRRRSYLAKLPGQVTSAHQCFRSQFHSALLPGVARRRNWAAQRTSTPTRPPAPSSARLEKQSVGVDAHSATGPAVPLGARDAFLRLSGLRMRKSMRFRQADFVLEILSRAHAPLIAWEESELSSVIQGFLGISKYRRV